MTSTALAVAGVVALLAGHGETDREAYAIYQARLAAIEAPPAPVAGAPSSASPASATAPAPASGCLLAPGSGNTATVKDCTTCHASYQSSHSHPVDVYQDSGRSRSLRRSDEVVKRGVLLPDGKVTCLSCHDGNSPWRYKIALPPSSQLRPRVKPGSPATYASRATYTTMPTGADVSPAPLCTACHAMD